MTKDSWQPVSQKIAARATSIPGVYEFQLDVRGDNRGWFKENFQINKLIAALDMIEAPASTPLRSFNVVQNNFSFNAQKGVARGIHCEPWHKYISTATGEAFAAVVDFRKGTTFGNIETFHITPNSAIFVPEGCGNSYQALTDELVYTYLVNAHWSADAKYTFANLRDPDLAIQWPIPLDDALLSDKDKAHPPFSELIPLEIN